MGALFDFLLSGGGGSAGNSPTLNEGDRSAHACQSGAIEGAYLVISLPEASLKITSTPFGTMYW